MNENRIYLNTNNSFLKHTDVETKLVVGEHSDVPFDVSIMIPTFQRIKLLKEAIFSALHQKTELNVEVVVVDNSTDISIHREMDAFLKSLLPAPIKLYRNSKNIGMFGNWNKCITLCSSPWLVILNDDDLLDPSFIEEMWKIKSEDTILHCLAKKFGQGYNPKNDTNVIRSIRKLLFPRAIDQYFRPTIKIKQNRAMYCNPIAGTLGAFIPKEIAINLGGFNEDLWPTADYDFIIRAIFEGIKVKRLNKFLAFYRIEENESLKIETLESFLYNDYLMRLGILRKLNTPNIHRKILEYLIQYQARLTAHVEYTKINHNFNPEKALALLNISQKKPFFKSNAFPIVALLWRLLWRPIKSNPKINSQSSNM